MTPEKMGEFLAVLVRQGTIIAREMSDDLGQYFIDGDGQKDLLAKLQKGLSGHKILWSVTSDGRAAAKLISDLKEKKCISDWAINVVQKPQFVTTNGITYRLVGIHGDEFEDDKRTTKNIFKEADRRGYLKPPAEVAVLLREKFSQEELGYPYIAVFHEPICDSNGYPSVLELSRSDGHEWLSAWCADPDDQWAREDVFVFLAPQVSS